MLTNYLINKHNEEILSFLKYNKNFLLPYLSAYGQLNYLKINNLQSILNWESRDFELDFDDEFGPSVRPEIRGISDNTHIEWSLELIDQFKEKWNWKHLSRNVSLNWWSEALLKFFEDKWDWIELSNNINLNLNSDLIEKFKTKWNWNSVNFHRDITKMEITEKIITGISGNSSISWDYEKINKFQDHIDWHALSLNTNIEFTSNIRHNKCYYGKIIGWSFGTYFNLLNEFENWNFKSLSYNPSLCMMKCSLPERVLIEFLDAYEWDWTGISKNPSIPWTYKTIETFKDRIDWKSFSRRELLSNCEHAIGSWSTDLIEKYIDKLDWSELSSNPYLPWSNEFIDRFKDRWSWRGISLNEGIPWSKELLSRYENQLHWDLLSEYAGQWDKSLIMKFQDKINWKKLSYNKKVKWTLSLLKEHRSLDLNYIFTNQLETPLSWECYRFYIGEKLTDTLSLLQNIHFCESIIKPILSGQNYEVVLRCHLDRCYSYYRDHNNMERYSKKE
jgi:hypothetical protein